MFVILSVQVKVIRAIIHPVALHPAALITFFSITSARPVGDYFDSPVKGLMKGTWGLITSERESPGTQGSTKGRK